MTVFRCSEPRRDEGLRGANGERFWLEADGEGNGPEWDGGAEDGDTERDRGWRYGREGVDALPCLDNRRPLFIILGSNVPLGGCPGMPCRALDDGGVICLL